LAAKYNVPEYGIMLSWLLHHAPNMLLIPGTSKVAHLEENVRAAAIPLTEEDMASIEEYGPARVH
jgi:aryl-alcohol dehydrogenase-like predicted oxidoreductase